MLTKNEAPVLRGGWSSSIAFCVASTATGLAQSLMGGLPHG